MSQIGILKQYGIRPEKLRGQHFLIDENLQRKIVGAIGAQKRDVILEIGAGVGALTAGLLESQAIVIAVEKDPRLCEVLKREFGEWDNLRVLNQDILKVSFTKLSSEFDEKKLNVCGNLPYYLTSPILFHLIEERCSIDSATVMVQKEVAERILARPGSKEYGRVTLAFRYFAEVTHEFDVGRSAFRPVPNVDSSVLRIEFHRKEVPRFPEELLFKIIQAAFAQRRKNILNALSASFLKIPRDGWEAILGKAGIERNARAEQLTLEKFVELARNVARRQ